MDDKSSSSMAETQSWRQRQLQSLQRGRKIRLVQGPVLSADYPVPSAIQNAVQPKYRNHLDTGSEEFTHMRYTAATCDPTDFTLRNGYNLRPAMYNRHTELAIAVTYFNENKTLFCKTFHSIMKNIRDIVNLKKSEFWNKGGPAWQKIWVCFILDGIDPCDKAVLDCLATVGLYQDGIMKKDVDGRETKVHIFEYTTQLSITSNQQLVRPLDDNPYALPPVQMALCLKQRNCKKINSHRWFFSAFGRILNPEVCVTIDTGTKVGHKGLLALWESFYNDKYLGGACGEIKPSLSNRWKIVLNPLVAAQHFEYKVSCTLDKSMESFFGYLTVLPGAFSAYRFRAIMGRPLEQYFYGDSTLDGVLGKKGFSAMSPWRKNMYLAEDRILSFALTMKAGSKWHQRIIYSAKAETDVPETVVDFIMQRRRWLNGSLAATTYSLATSGRIFTSGHSFISKALFILQLCYNVVSFLLSWFNIAAFLLATFIVCDISGSPPAESNIRAFPFGSATPIFNAVVQTLYLGMIIFQFILALGNRPTTQRRNYINSFVIFGFVQLYLFANVLYLMTRVIQDKKNHRDGENYNYITTFYSDIGSLTVWVTCASVFGVYYASAILNMDPWHMIFSYPQYLFVASCYTNILNIYAFSNSHNVSWDGKEGIWDLSEVLPSATVKKSPDAQEIYMEEPDLPQADIDFQFEATVKRALQPYMPPQIQHQRTISDDLKEFRTKLVAIYIFSNFALCLFVMNGSFDKLKFLGDSRAHEIWYFRIWMWATSGCFLFRFAGSLAYRMRYFVYCIFRRR